jgi:protein TorT
MKAKELRRGRNLIIFLGLLAFVMLTSNSASAAEDPMAKWALSKPWYPLEVMGWYGKYDVKTLWPDLVDLPAKSLEGPKMVKWAGPVKAKKRYHLGFAFPHLMDPYWVSVLYGIMDEARLSGVDVSALTAGGYGEKTRQISQVETLVNKNIDGLIMSVVSYGGLTPTLEEAAKKGVKVLLLINDADMVHPVAKAMTAYYNLGLESANIVIDHSKAKRAKGEKVKVAFFPGPGGLSWSTSSLLGFKGRIKEAKLEGQIEMVAEKWGVSEKAVQLSLLEPVLTAFPDLDYVVGNTVFADAAAGAVERAGRAGKTHVVSTYMAQPVYEGIKAGKILGAPQEFQQIVGRLAVDQMVRTLNGEKPGADFPYHMMPKIVIMTKENIDSYAWEYQFEPKGWNPVFEYKAPR